MHISAHITDTNWRYEAHLDGADQRAAIEQCSADGAAVIASTLAEPEAVTDSLLAAKAAGARIVTFNSGAGFAAAAGSEIHVALNDRDAGVRAAQRIGDLGVTGPIVCVIHEQGNIGLEERCEGLEAAYQGASVRRLHLTEGASDEQVVEELIAKLTDPDWSDVEMAMTLNGNTLLNALKAYDRIHADSGRLIRVLPIGSHPELANVPLEVRRRHYSAPFNDSVNSQGFFVLSAMHFVFNRHIPPGLTASPQIWLSIPFLIDTSKLRAAAAQGRTAGVSDLLYRYLAEAEEDDE